MKKSIGVLSLALLVVSLGTSLALAAPNYEETTEPTWEYISSSIKVTNSPASQNQPTHQHGKETTTPMMGSGMGPMMTTDQMQSQMRSHHSNGMMSNSSKDMSCQPNTNPAK